MHWCETETPKTYRNQYKSSICGGAPAQHKWCDPITWAEAMPGDLAFYPGESHVGIVSGYDEVGNVQIIHCAYSANNVVVTGKSGFTTVGRPKFYN